MVPQYSIALTDFVDGLTNWRMWGRLGWQEIKRRYRRTVIGPFWNTLSLGVFMVAFGIVWANLWHQDPKAYLPFVCTGFLAWNLVAAMMGEGCVTFVSGESLIKQLGFSYSVLACTLAWRHVLTFLHNLLIFVAIAVYAGLRPTWPMLLAIPGIFLIWFNGVWMSTLLGMLCARYRDMQQVVMSVLQISMFVTPIFFTPEQLGQRMGKYFAQANPLFHYVNILRAPMLGKVPSYLTYEIVLLGTAFGWGLTFWTYSRFRRRLAYWL